MWPFTPKPRLANIDAGTEGQSLILTEEEQAEIRSFFATLGKLDGMESDSAWYIHPAAHRALTASALIGYAQDQVLLAEIGNPGVVDPTTCLRKGLEAARKAYSFHPLPIYMFDVGCFLEVLGDKVSADNAFKSFLELQHRFKPNDVDELTLRNRDVDAAVRQAKEYLNSEPDPRM